VKLCRNLAVILAASLPALAGENAVLSSGLRIHIDRHETSDGTVRLYAGGGVTELPEAAISGFEIDDAPIPVPPAPQVAAAPVPPTPKDARTLLHGAAVRQGLPPAFVESVARTESAMNQKAISPKGAVGVMQLMPETAKALGADPSDMEQNIDAGTRLLRELLLKYNGDVVKALAAYNAGPAAVDRYNGIPPYTETQRYVNSVIRGYLDASPHEAHTGAAQ
jgi:soluble lytic murein transglycosylase-like protein